MAGRLARGHGMRGSLTRGNLTRSFMLASGSAGGHAQRAQGPDDDPGEDRARGQLGAEDGDRGDRVREHQEDSEDDRGGLHGWLRPTTWAVPSGWAA